MFQPRAKLEFVSRYCPPREGWLVCVDIDPSEEGRTGGERRNANQKVQQFAMQTDAGKVRQALSELGVTVGRRKKWSELNNVPYLTGDPDIVAFNFKTDVCLIAEVEGESSGQPEQKLSHAIGQIVRNIGKIDKKLKISPIIVVFGAHISNKLAEAYLLSNLGVAGLSLNVSLQEDRWLFGTPL